MGAVASSVRAITGAMRAATASARGAQALRALHVLCVSCCILRAWCVGAVWAVASLRWDFTGITWDVAASARGA